MKQDQSQHHSNLTKPSLIQKQIEGVIDALSQKQKRLAQYFLDHEAAIAFTSANEIASAVEVSPATVVRFARVLGYEGFSDLQESIQLSLLKTRTASQQLEARLNDGGFNGNVPEQIARINAQNIKTTMKQVSQPVLEEAVAAILHARHVSIFGGGMSAAAATLAEHSLLMLGIPARAVVNGGLAQTLELARLERGDVVIAISIWRYLRDTIDAIRYARDLGAKIITLTDSPISTAARMSDCVFVAATERAAHSRSLTGIMSLIDLINATIVANRPRESMEALKRIDDAYAQQGRLIDE